MSEGVSFTSACGHLFSVLGSNSAMISPLPGLNQPICMPSSAVILTTGWLQGAKLIDKMFATLV